MEENKNLQPFNTMNIAVKANSFLEIDKESQLLKFFTQNKGDFYVLGGGSNVLFRENFKGTILKINLKGIHENKLNKEEVELVVAAGENWHQLVMYALSKDYGGLENLSLIPGTVGACPIQNIGAYGVEVKDLITTVRGFNIVSRKFESFSNQECEFGYRDSIFKKAWKNKFIITQVAFKLSVKNHQKNLAYGAIQEVLTSRGIISPTIQEISKAVIQIREEKLPNPNVEPNTGSFFKNPILSENVFLKLKNQFPEVPHYKVETGLKVPAGWLIEKAGWKGKRENGVGVHPRQALVIVNYESRTGKEVYNFSEKVIKDVAFKFGITLEREVNVVN